MLWSLQHHSVEVVKWEESKKWQRKVDTLRVKLSEKHKELEATRKQVNSLKEMLSRCVCVCVCVCVCKSCECLLSPSSSLQIWQGEEYSPRKAAHGAKKHHRVQWPCPPQHWAWQGSHFYHSWQWDKPSWWRKTSVQIKNLPTGERGVCCVCVCVCARTCICVYVEACTGHMPRPLCPQSLSF